MDNQTLFLIAAVVVVCLCYLGAYLYRKSKQQRAEYDFLQRYPNAVKLYFQGSNKKRLLSVPKVDDENPTKCVEKKESGIFLVPGAVRKLNLLCEVVIPRTNAKTVYTAVQKYTPESGKTYALECFDDVGFVITEI